jgi:NAD(P)-dependent dehydrogenase (short-subunit alcohol dehydrogenase family)
MRTVQELFSLAGKTALVTGGSRGLGLQMAEALGEQGAKRRAGPRASRPTSMKPCAHLAARGIDAQRHRRRPVALRKPHAEALVTRKRWPASGHIDILVNNAGASWGAPAEDYPVEAWDKVMNLNVRSIFLVPGNWSASAR